MISHGLEIGKDDKGYFFKFKRKYKGIDKEYYVPEFAYVIKDVLSYTNKIPGFLD